MTLRFPQERHELLQAARARQQTEEFKNVYHGRAGTLWNLLANDSEHGPAEVSVYWSQKTHSNRIPRWD